MMPLLIFPRLSFFICTDLPRANSKYSILICELSPAQKHQRKSEVNEKGKLKSEYKKESLFIFICSIWNPSAKMFASLLRHACRSSRILINDGKKVYYRFHISQKKKKKMCLCSWTARTTCTSTNRTRWRGKYAG